MATSKTKSAAREVLIANARLSFPHLFKPSMFGDDPTKEPTYQATFIVDKGGPEHAKLKAAIMEVIREQWGNKPAGLKHCLRNGEEKEFDGYGPDKIFVSANNITRVSLFDRNGTPLVEADGRPYAGCYVNAKLRLWAQDHPKWGKRVNAQLLGVMFSRDGDAFGGGAKAATADDFAEFITDDDAPLEGFDDDDPLG